MNYKETLLFIAKCLTITHEKDNREMVEKKLKTNLIDWGNVVKISTAHYVFPALYCNLKRVNFLRYLPTDLVEYMQHITNLNRERNQHIITEATEINNLLLSNNITPIFLKGTGNLLHSLYDNVAERMVGDIDVLVDKKHLKKTVDILKENGYKENSNHSINTTLISRHYPRMVKENKIAAVEVHYKMITEEKGFDYCFVKDSVISLPNQISVLSYENQVLLTCLNKQLNDKGQWTKTISLRNSYDLYLLSKKTTVKDVLKNFKHTTSQYLINFVSVSSFVFKNPKSLAHNNSSETDRFLKKVIYFLNNPNKAIKNKKKWDTYFLYKHRFLIVIKSFYKKEYRKYVVKRLIN